MRTFQDLWASYCARHGLSEADCNFGMDLMRRSADVMRERAAQVVDDANLTAHPSDVAAHIRALTDG